MRKYVCPKPEEIRALRASTGLTQAKMAEMLYTSERAYRHYEGGDRTMHASMWRLMRLLIATLPQSTPVRTAEAPAPKEQPTALVS